MLRPRENRDLRGLQPSGRRARIVYSTEGDRVCRRCAATTSSAHASEVLSAAPSGALHYALIVAAPFAALAGLWTLAAASRLVFLCAVVTLWIVRALFARA
ncbi:MAG: hypothetical protein IPG04_14645 [Polyangiaceae bacterium]|nr:hypothetical protein [Polyangiaceae bacterium]